MANDNKKYIPALRFPEFQNDGEWELRSLSEILNYEQPGAYIVNDTNYKKTGTPVLTANKGFILGYTDESYGVYNDLPVIIFDDFTTDKKFVNFPFKVKSSAIKLLTLINKNRDDLKFIFECMKNIKFEEKEHKRYYISTYQNIKILVPKSTNEQKKIANCFVSIDKEIDATKRKLEQKKEHKKGLMQKLFPAKGKTLPELRFPEFQNDGEWTYDYGDALFDSIVNKNHNSELPILAITQENGAVPRDMINYRVIVEDKSIEGYKVVDIGDFIISLRTFQGGIEYSMYKGICSPAYIVLRKKHNNICNDFYRHYFKSFQYIQDLNRNLEGIRDGKMVSYKQFSEIKIPYPRYEEQCKVANCLTSLDKEINAIKDKIMALEIHKNGLMQQLFPKL